MATRFASPVGRCTASLLLAASFAAAQEQPTERLTAAVSTPFTWSMAGVLVKADRPLQGTAATLLNNHFSYIGNYGVNGCQNNNAPYSCAANGCNYPGNPSQEILGF